MRVYLERGVPFGPDDEDGGFACGRREALERAERAAEDVPAVGYGGGAEEGGEGAEEGAGWGAPGESGGVGVLYCERSGEEKVGYLSLAGFSLLAKSLWHCFWASVRSEGSMGGYRGIVALLL